MLTTGCRASAFLLVSDNEVRILFHISHNLPLFHTSDLMYVSNVTKILNFSSCSGSGTE
uniref:Uncharacterized protein n=1 Tax=Anguilla anguilla TaxID=7936 RepID=A0A0E9WG89_ANGAN